MESLISQPGVDCLSRRAAGKTKQNAAPDFPAGSHAISHPTSKSASPKKIKIRKKIKRSERRRQTHHDELLVGRVEQHGVAGRIEAAGGGRGGGRGGGGGLGAETQHATQPEGEARAAGSRPPAAAAATAAA